MSRHKSHYLENKSVYLNLRSSLTSGLHRYQCEQYGGALDLRSADFTNGDTLNKRFAHTKCGGSNILPTLNWTADSAARSYALIVDDPDAPNGTWTHLVCWNIPATTTTLDNNSLHSGRIEIGKNSWGETQYGGPCPPKGSGVHHYRFTLYALGSDLKNLDISDPNTLKNKIKNSSIDESQIVGLYEIH